MTFFRKVLPHLCLIGSLMILVLYVIDQINPAMHMIGGHEVFNTLLLIFAILVLVFSIERIVAARKR